MQRKTLLAALIAILNGTAYQAHAYSVTVVASRPVEQQVVPRMEAIKGVLSVRLSFNYILSWKLRLITSN